MDVTVQLRQGTTILAQQAHTDIGTTVALHTINSSATVTNWNDLRLRFITTAGAPPPAGNTFFTDFATAPVGVGAPPNWEAVHGEATEWEVATTSDGRALSAVNNNVERTIVWLTPGMAADMEVLAQIENTVNNNSSISEVIVRQSADGRECYRADIDTSGNMFRVRRQLSPSSGGILLVGSVSFTCSTGVRYWVRLRAIGSRITAKVWQDGTAEPAGWMIDEENTDITAPGYAGSRGYRIKPWIHCFGVGLNGATAPAPGGTTPPPADAPAVVQQAMDVTPATSTSKTSWSVTLNNVGASNRCVVVMSMRTSSEDIPAPTGWTRVARIAGVSTSQSNIYVKDEPGGGTVTFAYTTSSGRGGALLMMEVSNISTATPATAVVSDTATVPVATAAGSITIGVGATAQANNLVVAGIGITELVDQQHPLSLSGGFSTVLSVAAAMDTTDRKHTSVVGVKPTSAIEAHSTTLNWTPNRTATAAMAVLRGV
jgi:hypothetical protein